MEAVTSGDLFRIVISGFVVVVAIVGVAVTFMTFMFNRIDKRFEVYEKLLTTKFENYPTKDDIYKLQAQMSKDHETLATKVDDLNALLLNHVNNPTLHTVTG